MKAVFRLCGAGTKPIMAYIVGGDNRTGAARLAADRGYMQQTDMTLEGLRPRLIEALLPHVAFDGWSAQALRRAAADLGIDPEIARLAFPRAGADIVEAYLAEMDAQMVEALADMDLSAMKIRTRITTAVRTRLALATAHKEAERRASTLLLLPQNMPVAARTMWRTVHAMWRAAGDRSTDYNYYSKRTILAGVYSSTLLVWLGDETPDHAETWAFLDRRIENVMQFETLKARLRARAPRLPNPARVLGAIRYR